MKPTKSRNQLMYRAPLNILSKQQGSTLSKELRKKYGKRSVRVVKGDTVKIMRGEFKGVDGKVSQVSTEKNSVAIEGIKKEQTRGEKYDVYIHTSNLMVTALNLEDKWRANKLEGKDPRAKRKEKPKEEKTEPTQEKPKRESKETKNDGSEKEEGS